MTRNLHFKVFLLALACFAASCSVIQPTDPNGPRNAGPLYPILFTEQDQRDDAAILAFNRLTQSPSTQTHLELQPITAVLKSLPANPNAPVYLPKVGVSPQMNEEETRESLRRFITDWRVLIGADPAQLSLVERTDRPDGVKIARYQQRPFRYPLRGGYGNLEIQFLANRIVRNMTSTCIPDAERMQAALAPVVPKLTAADAVKALQGADVTYTNANGQQVTTRVGSSDEIAPVELVTLVTPTPGSTNALEIHFAWEIIAGGTLRRLVYVDAVDGKILNVVAS